MLREITTLITVNWISLFISGLVGVATATGTIVGAIFGVRKIYRLIWPIKIEPKINMSFTEGDPDSIIATITNKSNEKQYIVNCVAKQTYSLKTIVIKHLKNPFFAPRLYQNLRYGGVNYSFFEDNKLGLEPLDQVTLSHKLSDDPLSKATTPMIHIEVELSTGRTF